VEFCRQGLEKGGQFTVGEGLHNEAHRLSLSTAFAAAATPRDRQGRAARKLADAEAQLAKCAKAERGFNACRPSQKESHAIEIGLEIRRGGHVIARLRTLGAKTRSRHAVRGRF